jgi:hypothetical protein
MYQNGRADCEPGLHVLPSDPMICFGKTGSAKILLDKKKSNDTITY